MMESKTTFAQRWRRVIARRSLELEALYNEPCYEEKTELEELWEIENDNKFYQCLIKDDLMFESESLHGDLPLRKDEPLTRKSDSTNCEEKKETKKKRRRRRKKQKANTNNKEANHNLGDVILEESEEMELIGLLHKYRNTSNVRVFICGSSRS
eukprot:TRINITY_DN10732_c0_g1_i9.p1 TRINITY_DN10732_c0_g1~~TRINITY_DN10732_c0_g1_i9.p1  ORF type:complete len:154 (+),score=38.69 TRINITY_DN10732_c0_g1_i9:577-1038(+)